MTRNLVEYRTYDRDGVFIKVFAGVAYSRGGERKRISSELSIEVVDIQPEVGPFETAYVDRSQLRWP